MNRIIKFRTWDKKEKKMYNEPRLSFGASLDGPFVSFLRNGQWIDCHFSSETVAVMQFTGLKDKNGKEIWESDLVKEGKKIFKVLWNDLGSGGWWFAFKNKEGECQHASKVNVSQLEVIGNIHENKDLLK